MQGLEYTVKREEGEKKSLKLVVEATGLNGRPFRDSLYSITSIDAFYRGDEELVNRTLRSMFVAIEKVLEDEGEAAFA